MEETELDESAQASLRKTKRRGTALRAKAFMDRLEDAVAFLDCTGRIVEINETWRRYSRDFPWMASTDKSGFVFDERILGGALREAQKVICGIKDVIQGNEKRWNGEYLVNCAEKPRWFFISAELLGLNDGSVSVAIRDVTSSKKMEHDLRESHLLFQHVVEGMADGVFLYDLQGRFLMHNRVCNEILSQHSQLIGKNIEETFPPHLAQFIRGQNELVLGTGRTIGYEMNIEVPSGFRTLLVHKGIYKNHRNETVGIIGIFRDITERKQAEEKLKQSESRFRALIEKSADCIALIDEVGKILYVTPSAKQFFGYEPWELVGTNAFFWVHPDDLGKGRANLKEILELPGASMNMEYRSLCKNGNWKWIELTGTNLLHDLNVEAIVLNLRDISGRKEAELTSRRLAAIVTSSIDGICSIDAEGKITSWNASAQRIFGYSQKEIIGGDFWKLVPADRKDEYKKWYDQIMQGKAISNIETVAEAKGKRRVEVTVSFSPIHHGETGFAGFAMIIKDISERRRLEKEVLEIADFEKQRIGQDLHDDLCQHLVGISMIGNLLYADLEKMGIKQAEDAKEITRMIRNAVDHARILAKGLSPLNITNAGISVALENLAANTERLFRMPCHFECSGNVHIEEPEVATHLFRIVQEALHNAVKHSQGTRVAICLGANSEWIKVSISDDGVGPPDPKKRPKGSGLGMHTMAYRARMIGAEMEVLRNHEGGTTVVCHLPMKKKKSNGKISAKK